MKKIINGKLYNTETAERIDNWENMNDYRNFNYFSETMYRKRTGEFFLHGEGGPASPYHERVDQNSYMGGERIRPLTPEEAREWAEEHMDADDYQRVFGEVSEGEGRTVLSISIDTAVAERIRRLAAENGTSVSATIEQAFKA